MLWRNPHAYFSVRADGVVWEIETSSLTVLKRMGIDGGHDSRRRSHPHRGQSAARRQEGDVRAPRAAARRPRAALNVGLTPRWTETRQAVGDESLLMAREGDGSRPDLGIFRVWSHTRDDRAAVSRGHGPDRRHQRVSADAGRARRSSREFDRGTDNPTANCVPKGMPTIMEAPYPIEFVRQDNGDILLKLEEYDLTRYIYMNPSAARELTEPTPLGDSVGRWDGATLVVTTTRISWPFFSQLGIRQSPAVEIVERFTPTADGSRLDYEMTVTDPATFTRPVVLAQHWLWLPSVTLLPYECTVR